MTEIYTSAGRLLSRIGQASRASDYFRKAIGLAEELSNAAPRSVRMQRGLADAYSGMAAVYLYLPAKKPAATTTDSLREAKAWLQKSLTIYQALQANGTLSGADANKPDELARAVARCDASLAALH